MSLAVALARTRRRLGDPWRVMLCLCAGLLAVGVPAASQAARTINVCASGCAFTTIGGAVAAAQAGDTINVQGGNYNENLTISIPLTIVGSGEGRTIVASATSREPVFTLAANGVRISDLTVTGAFDSEGGGVSVETGAIATLNAVTVRGNSASGIVNDGTLTLSQSIVTGNDASRGASGGGIRNDGTATIRDSRISNNTATVDGGGIWSDGTLTVIDTTLNGNSAGAFIGHGGGLAVRGGSATLQDVTIRNNTAFDAGGIFSQAGSSVTLHDTVVHNNSTPQCDPTTLC